MFRRSWAALVVALVLKVPVVLCQTADLPKVSFQDQDKCGNPLMESQLWLAVRGTVREVAGPDVIRLAVSEPVAHELTVKLVGIRGAGGRRGSREAVAYLRGRIQGREVQILLVPDHKYFDHVRSMRVKGSLWMTLEMVERGLVAYEKPPAYHMSHYEDCVLRFAETKAKRNRTGIWAEGRAKALPRVETRPTRN